MYTISNSRIKLGSKTSANETPAAVALPSSERAAFTKTSYLRRRGRPSEELRIIESGEVRAEATACGLRMNCAAHSATSCVSKKPMTTERSPSVRATASPTDWSVCAGAPTLATRKSATAASVHARVYGTGSGSSRRSMGVA